MCKVTTKKKGGVTETHKVNTPKVFTGEIPPEQQARQKRPQIIGFSRMGNHKRAKFRCY